MSPPTDSHGPTDDMTRTERGPHCSKASYSGESMPAGLSAAMSGRCGTKLRVTARPQAFWPLPSGRAPSMVASGQPITHRPSMSDWVESVPSLSSSSSETEPPTAANWQQMRWVANGMGLTGEAMLVDGDGCTGAHRHEPALRLGRRREAGRRPSCPTQDGGQHRRGFATCEVSAGIRPRLPAEGGKLPDVFLQVFLISKRTLALSLSLPNNRGDVRCSHPCQHTAPRLAWTARSGPPAPRARAAGGARWRERGSGAPAAWCSPTSARRSRWRCAR